MLAAFLPPEPGRTVEHELLVRENEPVRQAEKDADLKAVSVLFPFLPEQKLPR